MPLFGKKKRENSSASEEKEKEANKTSGHLYPTQQQSSGQQSYYPVQGAVGGYLSNLPPQYSTQPYSAAAPPPYTAPSYPPTYSEFKGQTTVVIPDAFEAGARFQHGAQRNIPPPPPGTMPNAAQIAVAQGCTVVAGQKKETMMDGTGGSGYVVW